MTREVLLEVQDVEADAELCGDTAGIVGVVDGAATLLVGLARRVAVLGQFHAFWVAKAHEAADHLVALAQQQGGGDAGINAAGHGANHLAALSWHGGMLETPG